jgi:hypothetical protein
MYITTLLQLKRGHKKWRTRLNRLPPFTMISFLARTASSAWSPATRIVFCPSLSTVASTPVTTLTHRPFLFFSRASSSLPSENDDAVLRRDAIAEIIAAEYELKLGLSKKIVSTVFDTIVEVRVSENLILFTCALFVIDK